MAFLGRVLGLVKEHRHFLMETGLVTILAYFMREKLGLLSVAVVVRLISSDFGRRCLQTLPRDAVGLVKFLWVKFLIKKALRRNVPLHHYFLDQVAAHPDKECLVDIESGRRFTYSEFNKLCNKYANFFKSRGYQKGDVVALFLENSPEFLAIWLGLSKIGVITAWINSNLKLESLAHSINVSDAKSIVISQATLPALKSAIEGGFLEDDRRVYLTDGHDDGKDPLADLIKDDSEPQAPAGLDFHSVLCYVYTSGTTGNPKPAVIKHFRYYWMAAATGRAFAITKEDRMYVMMPMYHSAGGILGTGQVFSQGVTLVIRKKFSASNFWKDCIKHKCTVSQYIGEICRYLLAQKATPEERMHNVRLMFGNGLRAEIWPEFVRRFNIERIGELYGSTEGNSNIVNLTSHVGSCGFFPIYPFVTALYPVRLLKVDSETGEILRDKDGLCVTCRPGDTGEMVGVIKANDPLLNFEGYVDKADTSNKIVRDVCVKGDAVFSSGDILYWDPLGYLFFKDRRGDTYRWRGENVSTMQVEGILQPIMSMEEATVFGVEVKEREGRAGMIGATIAPDCEVEDFLDEAARRLDENLASYAIPVFVRICKEVDKTGTYKLKKTALQKEGFDLDKCHGDAIYYWDASIKKYEPMDKAMQEAIESGEYSKI